MKNTYRILSASLLFFSFNALANEIGEPIAPPAPRAIPGHHKIITQTKSRAKVGVDLTPGRLTADQFFSEDQTLQRVIMRDFDVVAAQPPSLCELKNGTVLPVDNSGHATAKQSCVSRGGQIANDSPLDHIVPENHDPFTTP